MARGVALLLGLLFLSSFALVANAQGSESNLFKMFWQQLNDLTTPQWDSWNPTSVPSQIFLMETPGFSIDPDSFDDVVWQENKWRALSPSYRKFLLTDIAPAYSNFMVDTGIRISRLWDQFIISSRTESPQDDPARAKRYNDAKLRIYNEDWTLKPVNTQRENLLNAYAAAIDDAFNERYKCLQRESQDPLICARKAIIWKEELSAAWYNFETLNRDLLGTQAEIMALQRNDLQTLLARAARDFQFAKRQEIGLSGFLEDYYDVSFEPDNWWTWWRECPTNGTVCTTRNTAFIKVRVDINSNYQERQTTFDRLFSTQDVTYSQPLIRIVTATNSTGVNSYQSLTGSGSNVAIEFEMAKVKINRPWLDMGLLRYSPLAITGLRQGAWASQILSSKDMFPLLPTSMVVARNIKISSTGWSNSMSSVFSMATTSPDVSVSIGPFSIGAPLNQYSSDFAGTSSSTFSNNVITIPGPQIIGYVCSRVPFFPNANVDDLATTNSTSRAPSLA